jgi:hypothetical protein
MYSKKLCGLGLILGLTFSVGAFAGNDNVANGELVYHCPGLVNNLVFDSNRDVLSRTGSEWQGNYPYYFVPGATVFTSIRLPKNKAVIGSPHIQVVQTDHVFDEIKSREPFPETCTLVP